MAVESDVVWQSFSGDGTTTSFSFTIPVQLPGDILVQYQASASGTVQQFAASNNFTLTLSAGDPAPGGTVSGFQPGGSPPAAGSTVTIVRNFTPLQSVVIDNQGGFEPTTVTDEFDRLVMYDQFLLDSTERSIRVPIGDASTGSLFVPGPELRAGLVLGFDANGNIALVAPGSGGGTISLPANAILLATNSSGQPYGVILGTGLTSSGGTLNAEQITLPTSAPLLSSTASQTLQGVQIGSGLSISSGTLSNTGNQLPANAALLASNSGGTATAVSLGTGISISAGTLTFAGLAVPINAAVLSSNSSGSLTALVLGTGLSSSGGTLSATAAGLPPSAALIGSNSSSQAVAVTLGSGLALSTGTLSATSATIPTNAALLASNSGATVTAVSLGAGLSINSGTLVSSASAVPANAALLGSNSSNTLTAVVLGAGLAESAGTLSITSASLPASAALLSTNSGGTATAVVLGSGLISSAGTLSAAASAVPENALLLGSNAGGTLAAVGIGMNLSVSGGVLSGTGAPALPQNALILGSNSSGTAVAVAVGSGLAYESGTLTASGEGGLPTNAHLLSTNSGGTAVAVGLGANLVSAGGSLSVSVPASEPLLGSGAGGTFSGVAVGSGLSLASGTLSASGGGGGGGGPYVPLGSGQTYNKMHNDYLKNQIVSAGGTQTLMSTAGTAGVITRVFIAVGGDANANNYSTLNFFRDGESTPSVSVHLSLGMMNVGDATFSSEYYVHVGSDSASGGHFYINAPFTNAMQVTFVNGSTSNCQIWTQVEYDLGGTYSWGDYAHLRNFTQGNATFPPTVPVNPYAELDLLNYTGGSGVVWGSNLILYLPATASLEGLVKFYIDGESTASYQTSGTEDYFGSAFYFAGGIFTSPDAGMTWTYSASSANITYALYRFHVKDPIKFTSSVRMTWQNGLNATGVPSTTGTAMVASNVWFYTAS